MNPENVTPPQVIEEPNILWAHPRLKGKIGLRVSVDWHNIPEPDPKGEYKLMTTGKDKNGVQYGRVVKVVEGATVARWLPLDSISSIED